MIETAKLPLIEKYKIFHTFVVFYKKNPVAFYKHPILKLKKKIASLKLVYASKGSIFLKITSLTPGVVTTVFGLGSPNLVGVTGGSLEPIFRNNFFQNFFREMEIKIESR